MASKKPSLSISGIDFYDAPSEIEGSPYWVDLICEINGYLIGLQVKPKSYNSASMSIYSGKSKNSQINGHKKFSNDFEGKVFIIMPDKGEVDDNIATKINNEFERLKKLPPKKPS